MLTQQVRYAASQFVLPFLMGVLIAILIVWWQTGVTGGGEGSLLASESASAVASLASALAAPPACTTGCGGGPEEDPRVAGEKARQGQAEEEGEKDGDGDDDHSRERIKESDLQQASAENGAPISVSDPRGTSTAANEKAERERAERSARGMWTCRHRWTKWLGQNSMYLPPGLSEHMSRYNRLHDKALRELPVSEALTLSLTSPRNTVRYIAWRPVGDDYAGRLLSLVSAYLLALLTDRVLLVNFPYVRHLLCEPFTRSSWIFPQKHLGDLNKFIKLREALQTRSPLRIARLKLNSQFTQDDESVFLSCNGNVKTMLAHVQILLVESPVGFAELLAGNPSHRNRLQQLFEDQPIYPLLMQTLLHPANDMWFRIIDAYHVHYTNDYDRPSRLAVHLQPPTSEEEGTLALKHRVHCALSKVPDVQFSRGRVVYYAPSSPHNNPRFWAPRVLKLPPKHHLVTATDENSRKGYLADWRRLFTDIWMASWTQELVVGDAESQTARVMHYYRGKSSWVVGDAGPEGECLFEELPATFMPAVPHSCPAFRQMWRSKHKTKSQQF